MKCNAVGASDQPNDVVARNCRSRWKEQLLGVRPETQSPFPCRADGHRALPRLPQHRRCIYDSAPAWNIGRARRDDNTSSQTAAPSGRGRTVGAVIQIATVPRVPSRANATALEVFLTVARLSKLSIVY